MSSIKVETNCYLNCGVATEKMVKHEGYKIEGALTNPLADLAHFWSLFELVVCIIGFEIWLRYGKYKNKIKFFSDEYTTSHLFLDS